LRNIYGNKYVKELHCEHLLDHKKSLRADKKFINSWLNEIKNIN